MMETKTHKLAGERTQETPYGALERLKNQIAWLEYVPEHEFTATESTRLVNVCEQTTAVLAKLNHKYND